ncbi:MAG: DUF1963 domain-containing protein [Anaerobiospirillum sp.]|nr:DUF1963 domain-containing protein [Anaerobiospirillum sp.]
MPPKKTAKPKPILKALRCRNRLAKLARPCVVLDTVTKNLPFEGEQLSERSFVGGNPLLPFDFKWPTAKLKLSGSKQELDVPMVFYLQIDLADVTQFDLESLLPDHGILAFFVLGTCMEFTDGPCQCVVRYFEHTSDLIEHQRNDPAEVAANARVMNSLILPHLPLAAHAEWSFPIDGVVPYDDDSFYGEPDDNVLTQERWDAIEYDYEELNYSIAERDGYDIFDHDYQQRNQMLGYASNLTQPDQQYPDDILLLEIGTLEDEQGNPIYPSWYTVNDYYSVL